MGRLIGVVGIVVGIGILFLNPLAGLTILVVSAIVYEYATRQLNGRIELARIVMRNDLLNQTRSVERVNNELLEDPEGFRNPLNRDSKVSDTPSDGSQNASAEKKPDQE